MTDFEFRLKQTYEHKKNNERWRKTIELLRAWHVDAKKVYHIHYLRDGQVYIKKVDSLYFAGSDYLEMVVIDEEYHEIYLAEIFKVHIGELKTMAEEYNEMSEFMNKDAHF